MTCIINPRDVLEYLNELGYKNITADELKEFIRDLKKLMKYDQRVQERHNLNIENIHPQTNYQKQDIFTSLYETSTASSKAKETSKKEKVISVQIRRPQGEKQKESSTSRIVSTNLSKTATETVTCCQEQSEKISDKAESLSSHRVKSAGNVDRASTVSAKPKASFIRPRIPLKPCKSDPVALYHQYQAEWKRQKIPGESNHADLRWMIREKMLGDSEFISSVRPLQKVKTKKAFGRL